MNAIRRADVTARVVAWHNRHPLARRIGPDQVGVIGVVALPFALTPGPSAPGRTPALTPLFGDDWMYRWRARRLGAWSQRHGEEAPPEGADWPLRAIDIDPGLARAADAQGLTARTLRHVLTAAIDADGRRTRVLLPARGPLRAAPVFGQRLPGAGRQAVLAGAGFALVAGLGAAAWWPPGMAPTLPQAVIVAQAGVESDPVVGALAAVAAARPGTPEAQDATPGRPKAQHASAVPAVASGPAASAAGDAAQRAEAAGSAAPAGVANAAPQATAPAASTAGQDTAAATAGPMTATIARPLDTGPVLRLRDDGAPPLVDIRPRLSSVEQQAARRAAATLRPPPQAIRVDATVYAIATAPTRSRDDALAQQALLQGLLAQSVTAVPTRLDVMAARGRWRAVWWPHPRREDAQALLQAARARGLAVELIAF